MIQSLNFFVLFPDLNQQTMLGYMQSYNQSLNFSYPTSNPISQMSAFNHQIKNESRLNDSEEQKIKMRNTWTAEEDQKIISIISSLQLDKQKKIPYKIIAKYFKNRTSKQIRQRYLNKLDSKILKSRFTEEQDQRIFQFYLENGPKWIKLSGILKGRTSTSLKNRFNTKLKQRFFLDQKVKNKMGSSKSQVESKKQSQTGEKKTEPQSI